MQRMILLLSVIIISCQGNNLYSFYSNGLLKNIPNCNNFEYYIIIPNAGCPGCITNAEDFLVKNLNSSKYFFIITNYSSKKALLQKFNRDILNSKNIVLDTTNIYFASRYKESNYPISILLEGNMVKKITIGTP